MVQLFLIRNWKIAAIVALTICLWLTLQWGKSQSTRAKEAEHGRDIAVKGLQFANKMYVNKDGDRVLQIKAYELDLANLKALSKSNDLQWLKKFEGLKTKNLQSAQAFDVSLNVTRIHRDTIFRPCKDSIKAIHFRVKDQWNDIDIKAIDTPRVIIKDRIYAVVFVTRPKGWFWKLQWGRWETKGEATNSNKLVRVDSSLLIVQKR